MKRVTHLPSVVGCAVGFAAAGSGVGSLVGTCFTPSFWPQPPQAQPTPEEMMMSAYGGTIWGIYVGIGVGFVAGIAYAVLVRRARLRGVVNR